VKPYCLEIYEPGSADDVLQQIEADIPFASVSAGDLLRPLNAPGSPLLRIVHVEHIVWETDGKARHKICLFTEDAPDARQTRLDRRN
jgi:hypothetical protein